MIQLYHGEDAYQSRQQLAKDLEKYSQVDYLDKKEIDLESLVKFSGGLFSASNKKALVLENLFSLRKKQLENIFEQLTKLSTDNDFFIWQGKKVTPSKEKLVKKSKGNIRHFKLPNHLFHFLDQLGQGNLNKTLKFYQKTMATHPPELLLFFLQRRAKKMYLAKTDKSLLRMPGWQKKKLYNQIGNLSAEQIENFYLGLIQTDWLNKTGRLGCELENKLLDLIVELETKENE
jgi:hypothetical protein